MFEFAFDNPSFSDRKLRLLPSSSSSSSPPPEPHLHEGEASDTIAAPSASTSSKGLKARSIALRGSAAAAACKGPDSKKLCTKEQQQHEEIVHVNTIILAKYSMFFWKMFDGDSFKESSETVIDVRLSSHEKEAFKDLLKYMYTSNLEAATVKELLLVWQLSDRFIVNSCLEFCTCRLQALPFTFSNSCFVLEKALDMMKTEGLQKLVTKSFTFLLNIFKDNGQNRVVLQQLSPQVLEFLLASEDLYVVRRRSLSGIAMLDRGKL